MKFAQNDVTEATKRLPLFCCLWCVPNYMKMILSYSTSHIWLDFHQKNVHICKEYNKQEDLHIFAFISDKGASYLDKTHKISEIMWFNEDRNECKNHSWAAQIPAPPPLGATSVAGPPWFLAPFASTKPFPHLPCFVTALTTGKRFISELKLVAGQGRHLPLLFWKGSSGG